MTALIAAALLVVYGLTIAELPIAEAALWSKQVHEPAFAVVPPRLSSKGRGEVAECQ